MSEVHFHETGSNDASSTPKPRRPPAGTCSQSVIKLVYTLTTLLCTMMTSVVMGVDKLGRKIVQVRSTVFKCFLFRVYDISAPVGWVCRAGGKVFLSAPPLNNNHSGGGVGFAFICCSRNDSQRQRANRYRWCGFKEEATFFLIHFAVFPCPTSLTCKWPRFSPHLAV